MEAHAATFFGNRWTTRQIAWAALLVYLLLIGGTPVGELSGWWQAVTGLLSLSIIAAWLVRAPRSADYVDIALVAALLLFVVTGLVSVIPRQSYAAAAQATTLVAGFYLARRALAGPTRDTVLAVLGWICLVVVAVTLPPWIGIWIRWLNISGWSHPPPLSVWLPPGLFDNRHYIGTLVILLAPALWSRSFRDRWPILAVAGTLGGALIVVMDASRTLWAAVVIASLVVGLTRVRSLTAPAWRVVVAVSASCVAVLLLLLVAAPALVERFGNLTKLLARFTLWENAIDAWLHHPIAGVGPGVYPFSYFLTDYFADHSYAPRHPDNALIQLLAESGLVGLAAAAIVVAAIVIASRHRWKRHPTGVWALTAFVVACVGTNPTDFVFLVVPGLLWAAMLVPTTDPFGAPTVRAWPFRTGRFALGIAALPLGVAIVLTSGASLAYQVARERQVSGDAIGAVQAMGVAVALDPGEAFYWRERGSLLLSVADIDGARGDFSRALDSVPFDPGALRGLSLADLLAGDHAAAFEAAQDAAARQPHSTASAIVLAVAAGMAGATDASQAALSRAMLEAPYFAMVPWRATVLEGTDRRQALAAASRVVGLHRSDETTLAAILVVILAGEVDVASAPGASLTAATHSARALIAFAGCDLERARSEIELARRVELELSDFWIASAAISPTPQSAALKAQLAEMYVGLKPDPGPTTISLAIDGTPDVWRYRRATLEITTPTAAMPAPYRGSWLLITNPSTTLATEVQWPPACGGLR